MLIEEKHHLHQAYATFPLKKFHLRLSADQDDKSSEDGGKSNKVPYCPLQLIQLIHQSFAQLIKIALYAKAHYALYTATGVC
ncbi:hypothetical protein BH09BAC6_BH09BAC6_24410 [soil metagenome]|jgi:hypothetical protein